MKTPQVVEAVFQYPRPDFPEGALWIYPVVNGGPTDADAATGVVADTLIDAYSGQFTGERSALTQQDVVNYVTLGWGLSESPPKRVEQDIEAGDRYWLASVRNPLDVPSPSDAIRHGQYQAGKHIVGFVQTGPSRPRMLAGPNIVVKACNVKTDWQRRGIGSALLHSCFRFGGYDETRQIVMQGPVGSGMNQHLTEVSMQWSKNTGTLQIPIGESVSPYRIPEVRYSSKRGGSIACTVRQLERRMPALIDVKQLPLR